MDQGAAEVASRERFRPPRSAAANQAAQRARGHRSTT